MGLVCGLLAVVWWELRKAGPVTEPWAEGDPGDEAPEEEVEEFDLVVDLDPTLGVTWAPCPRCGEEADRRARDGALWCWACEEMFLPHLADFDSLNEAA